MTALDDGDRLPEIELATTAGGRLNLRDFIGKPLVVYFYPKDDTPGCTSEAQDFSRLLPDFRALGAEVLGISRDTPGRHRKFIDKYDLTVPLATDDQDAAVQAFGVWVEKTLYGKTYMGIDRATFLFDAAGVLVRQWRKVRVPGHVENVLEAVRSTA